MKLELVDQDAEISHWLNQIIARFMRDGALPALLDEIKEDQGVRIWTEPGLSGCFKFTLPVAAL